MKKQNLNIILLGLVLTLGIHTQIIAQNKKSKPNIVLIMSDDVGAFNISTYNMGIWKRWECSADFRW